MARGVEGVQHPVTPSSERKHLAGRTRFRVASITTNRKPTGSVDSADVNAAEAAAAVRSLKTADPDLICLPEGFLYAGMATRRAESIATDPDGALPGRFAELARTCGSYLAVPLLERDATDHIRNTVVLFGRDGSRVGTYTKRIPWPSDPAMVELEYGVTAGQGGGPYQTDGGLIGVQTCLEIQWRAGWRTLKRGGAKLILFPSEQAGGALLGHRAWDAQSYVLSAVSNGGPSELRDPLGYVVATWRRDTRSQVVSLSLDYELAHLDFNETKLRDLARMLHGRVKFTPYEPERLCLVTSLTPEVSVRTLLEENGIHTLDAYLSRIDARRRDARREGRQQLHTTESIPTDGRSVRTISVIVPTAGVSPSLGACLEALRRQDVRVPYEVTLVVNGRTSESFESPDDRVSVIREPQAGPAVARNRGIRDTNGDCVAFIDDDCIASPRWLSNALDALEKTGGQAIVAGAISRSGVEANAISRFDSASYLRQEDYVRYLGACVTANLFMRRDTFLKVGPFDERFREAACEDWEWAGRARRRSIPIVFARSAVVDHPCMNKLVQLRRKAERLARGEQMLREIVDPRARPPGLRGHVGRQLKRFQDHEQIRSLQSLSHFGLALLVAFWMWRADVRAPASPHTNV
jgi:predicted amidohydrolase